MQKRHRFRLLSSALCLVLHEVEGHQEDVDAPHEVDADAAASGTETAGTLPAQDALPQAPQRRALVRRQSVSSHIRGKARQRNTFGSQGCV